MSTEMPATRKMIDRSDVGCGVFSNTANVAASAHEVFLDFGLIAPPTSIFGGENEITLVTRVILTKEHAIQLRDALSRTIEQEK
ncbi:MAG TPA: DUF3467 domain-containing protein [Candidatus Peribacteraceae bacterium]|nr:DUF3467 domain-containing protein [Candidatus Peribacteraceae bacterium]